VLGRWWIRRTALAGMVMSVGILSMLLVSIHQLIGYTGRTMFLVVAHGQVCFGWIRDRSLGMLPGPHGWRWFESGEMPGMFSLPQVVTGGYLRVFVPLWVLFILMLIPSLIMWPLSKRVPPGYCSRCKYDLTGNVSGVCSECGDPVPTGGTYMKREVKAPFL